VAAMGANRGSPTFLIPRLSAVGRSRLTKGHNRSRLCRGVFFFCFGRSDAKDAPPNASTQPPGRHANTFIECPRKEPICCRPGRLAARLVSARPPLLRAPIGPVRPAGTLTSSTTNRAALCPLVACPSVACPLRTETARHPHPFDRWTPAPGPRFGRWGAPGREGATMVRCGGFVARVSRCGVPRGAYPNAAKKKPGLRPGRARR